MYLQHFHLREMPFAIEPNPRFLLLGEDHREALATLVYAVEQQEGWALLLGEAGVGKTTLIMALLRELEDRVVPAVVNNPLLEPLDFFNLAALELGLDGPFRSKGQFLIALGQLISRCRQEGKVLLLVVDEAHSLTPRLLEELRLLGNLDDASPRVLNIFLVGQPRVLKLMKKAGAKGLMQRLRRHHLLKPLTPRETTAYVRHRLRVAGGSEELFDPEALAAVHQLSGGVPRLVNTLCDEALLVGFNRGLETIDHAAVEEAAAHEPLFASEEPEPGPEAGPPAEPAAARRETRAEEPPPVFPAAPPEEAGPAVDRTAPPPHEPPEGPPRPAAAEEEPWPPGRAAWERMSPRAGAEDGGAGSPEEEAAPPRPSRRPARRPARGSRLAASMSKGRPGSLWRRVVFLLIALAVVAGAYLLTSEDGMRHLKSLYRKVTGQSGPTLYMPEPLPENSREPAARPRRERQSDWGPAVPAPASPEGDGGRG
jgi:general secretion pathway protein A